METLKGANFKLKIQLKEHELWAKTHKEMIDEKDSEILKRDSLFKSLSDIVFGVINPIMPYSEK